MNADLIRFVDSISRDKNIEKDSVFLDLEAAMMSAAHKAFETADEVVVSIDRVTGEITATVDNEPIDMKTLGRIAAQTAKQVMMQKIREDERNSIFEEYSQRVGTIVTGSVARFEGGSLTVNLGRAEGFLPRSEQIPGDAHHPGERIRAMVLDVREEQNRVKIVLTQTHPDYIRKLFELEVPEVAERIIEVRALAREAGYRTKIAVSSIDMKVDAVGACVGVRGSRIRNIVDELGGEKIDIVRWNESSQVLISNALKPAEVKETFLCFELGKATVLVAEDQLSLAIGKRGQNVRLAARLTGWDIDITTPAEYDKNVDYIEKALKTIDGIADVTIDKLLAMGIVSLGDLAEVGVEPLVKDLELDEALLERVISLAGEESKRIAVVEEEAKRAAAEAAAVAAQAPEEADDETPADASDADTATEDGDGEAAPDADAGTPTDTTAPSGDDEAAPGAAADTPAEASETDDSGATEVAEAVEPAQEPAAGEDVATAPPDSTPTDDESAIEAGAAETNGPA